MESAHLRRGLSRLLRAGLLAALCMAAAQIASAQATTPTKDCDQACVNQHVQSFNQNFAKTCAADLSSLNQIVAASKSKQDPDIPEPPEYDPPCQSCDEANGPAPTPPEVQNWIDDSLKPESTMMDQLLKVQRDVESVSGSDDLTPANQHCLRDITDFQRFQDAVNKLLLRQWKKAQDMTEVHSSEYKRAYGGIAFINQVAKAYQLAFCNAVYVNMKSCTEPASGPPSDWESLEKQWLESVTSHLKDEIFNQHQYNLCPSYMSNFTALFALGTSQSASDLDEIQQTIAKIRQFLHFQITLNVKGNNTGKGASTNVAWQATGKFHIDINQQKACYTPTMDGPIQATVTNYSVPNVTLISPRSFSLQVDKLVLTMCDPNPLFVIRFKNTPPAEQVQAGGRTATAGLIGEPFGVALATPTLDLYGKDAKNATINTSSSYGLPSNTGPAQVDPTKEIQAHKGDPSWFLTAAGQQALQQMQAQVMQKVQGSAAATDILSGGVNYSPATLRVNWTNGTASPVDALLSPQIQSNNGAGSANNSVQVKVQQQSQ